MNRIATNHLKIKTLRKKTDYSNKNKKNI